MINQGDSTATVKTKIADALALSGIAAPTSWADAETKLNERAVAYGLDTISDRMAGGTARARINAVILRLEAPQNMSLPEISGSPLRGETLTANTGDWVGVGPITYSYQWFNSGSDIMGATGDSYVVQVSDIGFGIGVRVTATNTSGSSEAQSTVTSPAAFANVETSSLLAKMLPQPDDDRKAAIDIVYSALKIGAASGSNILAKLDALFLFGAHNVQAAPLNWAGGVDVAASGGIAYEVDGGYVGDGVDGYLSAGVAPGGLTKFTQNSAFVCIGLNVDGANINSVVGQEGGSVVRLLVNPMTGTGAVSGRLNSAATFTTTATVASRLGRTALSRINSTQISVYKDGTLVETAASTSATPSSQTDFISILRNNATYLDDGVNVFALGSGLTSLEVADFDAAIEMYATTIEPP